MDDEQSSARYDIILQDPYSLFLDSTASEPLTLSEEYEMQRKWANDIDKVTFIILSKSDYLSSLDPHREINCMAGDVNAFLSYENNTKNIIAELEIMIAEEKYRRMGFAAESLDIFMNWIHFYIPNISKFIAKIHNNNQSSLNLFQQKLKFIPFDRVEIFNEIHLELLSPFKFFCDYHCMNYPLEYNNQDNKLL